MSTAQTTIKLQSSDGAEIIVGKPSKTRLHSKSSLLSRATADDYHPEREVAERSVLIKNMMEDIGEQAMAEAIPIPNVSSPAISFILCLLII